MSKSALVRFNDFGAEPEDLLRAEIVACERVIRSGHYILGPEVENFERAWAEACGSRFAVGLGNGMDAIEIGLRSLGIGPGDEVITTATSAFATVLGILRAGATPVLADIRQGDALLDEESVQRCLTSRTRVVMPVHLYGGLTKMKDGWQKFCTTNGLLLLEDAAQAHLAAEDGQLAGTFGACGAFSFYPTKNLGAIGDGGALVTDSEEIAANAKRLRNYGQSDRYHHSDLGLNSRLDELQAAILSARLKWLERFIKRRREIAARYHSGIANSRTRMLVPSRIEESHVYHLFVVVCSERDRLMEHLQNHGIASLIHYPIPIHKQKAQIPKLRTDPSGLRRSEEHAATCLSLPCHPQMTSSDVDRVIDAVNLFA